MNEHSISALKKARIAAVYEKEPDLEMDAFRERFGVGKATLRAIFRIVDKRLGRVRRGTQKRRVHAKKRRGR